MLVPGGSCKYTMTPFFVWKQGKDKLRLVLDARATNQMFTVPRNPNCGSAAGLAGLRARTGSKLFTATSDLKDCFYSMQAPSWLWPYFSLPLSPREAFDIGLNDTIWKTQLVFPQITMLPMGRAWSVYFCQTAHENFLLRSSVVSDDNKVADTLPPQHLSKAPVWLAYIENWLVCGLDQAEVQALRDKMDHTLTQAVLIVHEQTPSSEHGEILGVVLDGSRGVLRPTGKCVWKIFQALTAALHPERTLSSRQVQILVGHLTFIWCLRIDLLAIPSAVHQFINKQFLCPRLLWPSVQRELR
jgi:hypothetical protein